jgi:hypothetical protein
MDQMGPKEKALLVRFPAPDASFKYTHFISYGGRSTYTLKFYYTKEFTYKDDSLKHLLEAFSHYPSTPRTFESFAPGLTYDKHQAYGGGQNQRYVCQYVQIITRELKTGALTNIHSSKSPLKKP